MKQSKYLFLNTMTLVFALTMNYLSSSGVFSGKTVGDVSRDLDNLFTPAGYAFAIWGLIYLLLIAFVAFQWFAWFKHKEDRELRETGYWFALSNLANGLWIFAWLNNHIGISLLLMLVLLFSLIMLTFRLRLEIWDAPVRIIAFVWWPVCIYLGWIIVATVANFAAFFVSIGYYGDPFSQTTWAIIMIIVSLIIYVLLIYFRNMREAALVGIWALVAIGVKQWSQNNAILYTALIAAAILFIYISWHGFKNRETSPFKKMQRGEI